MKIKYLVKRTQSVDHIKLEKTLGEVKDWFKERGTKINFETPKEIPLDESSDYLYKKGSIEPKFLQAISEQGYDGTVLFVNKSKAKEKSTLRGQQTSRTMWGKYTGLIEIYSEQEKYVRYVNIESGSDWFITARNKVRSYLPHDTYVLIHEVLHDLEEKYLRTNKLHSHIRAGKFEEYAQHIVDLVSTGTGKDNGIVDLTGFGLRPLVEKKVKAIFTFMALMGYPMRAIEGKRSCDKQNELYNKVPKVTNAKCGESFHQYGVAVDCNFLQYGWLAPSHVWWIFGRVAEYYGFEWGGKWDDPVDNPHIQLVLNYDIDDFISKKVDYKRYE